MNGRTTLLIAAFALTLTACKTQEDIRRERTVDNLNEQVQQTQKSNAGNSQRFNTLEEQVARLSGQVEEISHQRAQTLKDNQDLNKRLTSMEETNAKQVEYIKALTEKVNNQSDYIEEVIATLAKMNKDEEKPAKKKAVNERSDEGVDINDGEPVISYSEGLKKYRAKDLDGAKEIFKKVEADKKVKKKDREGATHFLGMIEYKNKNYEEAKVYFSNLFSENPKSSFAAASLINLAKTFEKLKSKEEAIMTIDELQDRFPKSKEAEEGAKLKAKLK